MLPDGSRTPLGSRSPLLTAGVKVYSVKQLATARSTATQRARSTVVDQVREIAAYRASVIPLRLAILSLLVGCMAANEPVVTSEVQNAAEPPPPDTNLDAEYAAAGVPLIVRRIIRLDPGQFVDGDWESLANTGAVASVRGEHAGEGGTLPLAIGWNVIAVDQAGCTPVIVPVRAEPGVELVSVPFLGCNRGRDALPLPDGTLLDRREFSIARMTELRALALFPDVPITAEAPDLPQRWLTWTEANDVCGFYGGRLMHQAEWQIASGVAASANPARVQKTVHSTGPSGVESADRAFSLGPNAHEDLVGNVAEWTSEIRQTDAHDPAGSVRPTTDRLAVAVGGSWLRRDTVWQVPANARSDEIGFRCAYPAESAVRE